MYSSQYEGSGDFFSFGLRRQKAELRFDVGSGTIFLTSDTLALDNWHTARIIIVKKESKLYSV